MSKETEKVVDENSLEFRGSKANEEIKEILKKYKLAIAVDIAQAQPFIDSLRPIIVDGVEEKVEEQVEERIKSVEEMEND